MPGRDSLVDMDSISYFAKRSCQGVSSAGWQEGMQDCRSNLIERAFHCFDSLTQGSLDLSLLPICTHVSSLECIQHARQVMVIENVAALISKQANCREVFNYIHQAGAHELRCQFLGESPDPGGCGEGHEVALVQLAAFARGTSSGVLMHSHSGMRNCIVRIMKLKDFLSEVLACNSVKLLGQHVSHQRQSLFVAML